MSPPPPPPPPKLHPPTHAAAGPTRLCLLIVGMFACGVAYCMFLHGHVVHGMLQCCRLAHAYVARRMLHAPRCMLHAPRCMFHAPRCMLHAPRCMLHAPRCISHAPRCMSHAPRCMLHAPRCMLHAPRCISHAPRCMSHAPRCMLHAPRCISHAPRCMLHAPRCTLHAPRCTLHAPRCMSHGFASFAKGDERRLQRAGARACAYDSWRFPLRSVPRLLEFMAGAHLPRDRPTSAPGSAHICPGTGRSGLPALNRAGRRGAAVPRADSMARCASVDRRLACAARAVLHAAVRRGLRPACSGSHCLPVARPVQRCHCCLRRRSHAARCVSYVVFVAVRAAVIPSAPLSLFY